MDIKEILYSNERRICSISGFDSSKRLILTNQRLIFLDYNSYHSTHLENLVSVRYTQSKKDLALLLGIVALLYGLYIFKNSTSSYSYIFSLLGAGLIIYYFLSRKSFIEITTKASEKIKYNIKIKNPTEIRNFCGQIQNPIYQANNQYKFPEKQYHKKDFQEEETEFIIPLNK